MPSLEVGPILRSNARRKSTFMVVVLQLASSFMVVACLLVVGAYFRQIGHVDSGYDVTSLVGVRVRVPRAQLDAAASGQEAARLAALPGVAGAAALWPPLRAEEGAPTLVYPADADAATADRGAAATRPEARGWTVYGSVNAPAVLGLRFVEGSAVAGGVVLTRRLRDRLFPPPAPALGRAVAADDAPAAPVVGVVEDVMFREPFWQDPTSIALHLAPSPGDARGDRGYLLRARPGARDDVVRALAAALPGGPARLVTVTPYGTTTPRFLAAANGLLEWFASLGLVVVMIALVGAVAVSSFVVAERRRQIGIRRAVGATRWDIFRYFLVEGSVMAALGIGIGLVLTIALLAAWRRVFPALPIDWRYLVGAAGLLWLNATVASATAARGAARVPPALAGRGRT